jgi:hypothetical protein
MPTRFNWRILNIVLPLFPLVLRGLIKLLMAHYDIQLIHASELWFVLAIIALIIAQDLKLRTVPLDNEDKQLERHNKSSLFMLLALVFIFCCPVSEMFYLLAESDSDTYYNSNIIITCACYLSAIFTICYALRTQKEFNLTAKIF